METWNMTVTNKGLSLQSKQISGSTLALTRVVTGTGITPLVKLKELTSISDIKQTITVSSINVSNNTFVIKSLLSNNGLESGYDLSQIGFYATDPDDGEILYAVAQINEPREIPSAADSPGYSIEFVFKFNNGQSSDVTVEIDPSGLLTVGQAEELINESTGEMVEAGPTITE